MYISVDVLPQCLCATFELSDLYVSRVSTRLLSFLFFIYFFFFLFFDFYIIFFSFLSFRLTYASPSFAFARSGILKFFGQTFMCSAASTGEQVDIIFRRHYIVQQVHVSCG